ncbi:MAG: SDR family NAD(P)-dependent oxidoreductase [Cyanobacteria bacterium P01_D01_bin.1]
MASQKDNRPLAIVHGSPFPDSADIPSSLIAALADAAKTDAGIRYVEADGTETVQSYAALLEAARQIATALHARRIDRFVILQFSKSVDLITALWGCFLSGCVPVPLSAEADQTGRQKVLEGAIALLDHPTLLTDSPLTDLPLTDSPKLAAALPITVLTLGELQATAPAKELSLVEPLVTDTALLLLTSGSTGLPKGVQLTHQNVRVSAYGMSTVNQISARDITLNWMPLEHVASLVMFHLTEVYLGCEQIHVAREVVLKDPLAWLDLLARYRVSASWAPNFAYGLVNDQLEKVEDTFRERSWDLSSIRWMGNGAEAVVGKTARQFLQLLMPHGLSSTALSPGYGMTETCSGIVHSRQFSLTSTAKSDVFVALGQPIPGVSIRIANDSDAIVPEGEIGRLQVKGLTVMEGYIASHNAAFTADGWFDTGDLAFIQSGSLTITGRQKDTIILNGVNYYSHEIESVVETLDGVDVSFTAACGVRSPEDATEQLAIFFHPVRGVNSEAKNLSEIVSLIKQIRTRVIEQLGISPTYVIPVEKAAIPKTSIGKLQRRQLSRQFASGEFDARIKQFVSAFRASSAAQQLSQTEIEQRISQIWQSVLCIETVDKNDNFFELGGTSLRLMQVLGQLQNQLSPTLKAVSLFQYPTVTAIAAHLKAASSDAPLDAPSLDPRGTFGSRRRQGSDAQPPDIAVIGMAGRFPGAPNLETFWQNLKEGVDSITFFTDEEMLAAGVDPALIQHPNYVNASPTLENIDYFDADFFGYSPKEARLMDPQQRLLLECAWESLETAGYDPLSYTGAIGLFAGATMNTYLLNNVYPNRHTLDPNDSLETFTLSSFGGFQATVANDKDYLTTRVSYKLNLRGPSLNVQTACSTSLVSIHLAAQSLLQGECDMALAGGVSVETPQQAGYLYQEGMILSDDGHCRAFDAGSKGTLFGSGVGLVVLKRLDEAITHKDFIYAVIKGSAAGNDGGQKVGYLAPLSEGQTRVAAEALAIADTPAETIGYVEAHGTGTQLGDPIEIAALTQAFRYCPEPLRTDKKQFCPIGSVKTNVGHLNIASGVVGFIKAALAIHHAQIPASLHFQKPNPQIDFANSPFYVNTALADWPRKETPRRASINSLGIGGTNVHMVLEEARVDNYDSSETDRKLSSREEIFVLSAKSEPALKALAQKYVDFLVNHSDVAISDVCFTLGAGRSHFPYRLSLVASSAADLRTQLQDWLLNSHTTAAVEKVAFLFTGQGAQSVCMGKALYEAQPAFHRQIDRCAEILKQYDLDLLNVLFGEEHKLINQTEYTQPALFAFEYAIAQLWISWGIQPAVVLGHSLGEYVAACVAGVFSLEDALKLLVERGRLIQALPTEGVMLSVMADVETCQQALEALKGVAIAATNAPENTVLSGLATEINNIAKQLTEQGIRCKQLQVSHAFHSALMAPILSDFRAVAASVTYRPPTIKIISNLSGETVDRFDADYWTRHIQQPVRFAQSIDTLKEQGVTTFLECGPRPVLLTLAQTNISSNSFDSSTSSLHTSSSHTYLASLQPNKADSWQMLTSLAALYRGGYEIDWNAFYSDHRGRRIPLPTYAFQRQRHWIDRPTKPTRPTVLADKSVHPLAGRKISTPLRQRLFQQVISSAQPEFLQHHQVQGQILLPGSAFLEIALSMGAEVLQVPTVRLDQVSILQPLRLLTQPVKVQTVLIPESDSYRFEIYSQPEGACEDSLEWALHCEGTARAAAKAGSGLVEIERVRDGLTEVRSHRIHYENCDCLGLSYSGPFRSVQRIWHTTDKALGQIQLSEEVSRELSIYQLHPAVLDACFQCVLAALPASNREAYIPIGVESICLHRSFPTSSPASSSADKSTAARCVWSYVQLRPLTEGGVTVTANVQILAENGELIASVTGLAAKRLASSELVPAAQNQQLNHQQLDHQQLGHWQDWLYEVEWKKISAASRPRFTAGDNWLIVSEDGAKLEAIAHQLAAHQQNCTKVCLDETQSQAEDCSKIDPVDAQGFLSYLKKNNHWKGVLYIASSPEEANGSVESSCKSVLFLAQALVSHGLSTRLWLVTSGAQAVSGDELLNVSHSPLWGMGKTIALEHPELHCVCLDFDQADSESQIPSNLIAEIGQRIHLEENQIAYRNGSRYAARLVRHASNLPESVSSTNLQLQIARKGTLEQLEWREATRRQPGPGEIELRVQATGLNFRDVLNALDLYPGEAGPLGLECVGEVVAIGADVDAVSIGDVMMAIAPASFSQFVTVRAALAVPKPSHLDAAEAATMPTAFLTAYYSLVQLGELKANERILIHAAAGGVGQAAVQIAQALGAKVFATASEPKWAFLERQGVQYIFNSRTLEFADQIMQQTDGKGVDVVLNSLSGDAIPKSLSVLSANGQFLEIGKAGIWPTAQMKQQRPDVSYKIIDLVAVTETQPQLIQSMLQTLVSRLQSNLSPLPYRVYLATQTTDAFRFMQQAKHIGKVVVTPPIISSAASPAAASIVSSAAPGVSPHTAKARIRADATYLVTGGTGALGLQLSRWLVEQGATSLILLSRSTPSESSQASINRLSGLGVAIRTLQSNLLDSQQLQVDLTQALESTGTPLRGIFHLAGEIGDSLLSDQSWQTFTNVLSAKVNGTWNLHQLTQTMDLDHFVMFSSAASLLGSAGQVNYAAANSFLDAITHLRHRQGLPALSINWAAWSGAGLANKIEVEQRLSRAGIPAVDPQVGFDILARLIKSKLAVQVATLPGDIENWKKVGIQSLFSTDLTPRSIEKRPNLDLQPSQSKGKQNIIRPSETKAAIQTAIENNNTAVLSDYIRAQLSIVLGKDAVFFNDDSANFTDLGLDSLTAVEFRNRLQSNLACVLPVTLIYEYPTLSKLRDYIVELLTPSQTRKTNAHAAISDHTPLAKAALQNTIENISDDEAQTLLLQELNKLDQA